MTREEFIEVLKDRRYSYEIVGDNIVVNHKEEVDLQSLETLPPGVAFKNGGDIYLTNLKTLLPPGVAFKNGGSVRLGSLETLPPGVHFENTGNIYLKGLGWVEDNKGIRIDGVDNKRLLNFMISKGVFI